MDRHFEISTEHLSLEHLEQLLSNETTISLSTEVKALVEKCIIYFDKKIETATAPIYGINTGFGSLCDIKISDEQIEELQHNLVLSHAAGIGDRVPSPIVRLILLLKIKNLSQGYSAIRMTTLSRLIDFFNESVHPVLYQLGSLGASGDLAPLAHLSLPLLGKGEVEQDGVVTESNSLLRKYGWDPLSLKAKEGLALLNGTQFSSAYLAYSLILAKKLIRLSNLTAAISIDAFNCSMDPFDKKIHRIRKHPGQIMAAQAIREFLEGSEIGETKAGAVQDPYAFRCTPQVHGATISAVQHVEDIVVTEVNAVTDNPNVFPDDDAILSGGNFHAQPLALAADYLAIAMAEIGSISERRSFQLLSGNRGLPAFLVDNPGINSGFMIPQYTAASIVSQNKQLCTPASIDSIVSSNGQEDHVSMAANAGTKCLKVVKNVERLIAIEFMIAAQALEYRRPLKSSSHIEDLIVAYRKVVPRLTKDRILSTDIVATIDFLSGKEILQA